MIEAGRITRVSWRILSISLVLCLLSLGRSGIAPAQQPDATNAQAAEPTTSLTGIFVTSLHDLDTVNGSFGVDYWVWSVSPGERNALESMEFLDAEQVETELDLTVERGENLWLQRKVSATVRQNWDLTNFPFDRHVLEVEMEEGIDDAATLTYRPDTANSGYSEDIELQGWRITDFQLREHTIDYATTFGDPAASDDKSSYSRLVASMEVERQNKTIFFKLIAGAYVAIAISLLTFLMLPTESTMFSGRLSVLVGALFATVIGMQMGREALGATETLSLVDKVHIIAMIYIFAAALMALIAYKTCKARKANIARRWDRISLWVFGGSFTLINGVLIVVAAIAG